MELFNWRATFDTSLAPLSLFDLWPQEDFYNLHLYFISINCFIFTQLFNLFEMNLESLALIYGLVKNLNVLKELPGAVNEDVFPRTHTGFAERVLDYGAAVLGAISMWCLVPLLDKLQQDYHIVSLFLVVAANLYMDVLLTHFIKFTEEQYNILCEELRGYCDLENEEIVSCWEIFNTLNDIIFAQFFVTNALALFSLSLIFPSSSALESLMLLLSSALTQLSLYCWHSSEVQLESCKIANVVVESDWNFSLKVRNTLLFFNLGTQTEVAISAFKLFPPYFMVVIRGSWSYYAGRRHSQQ